MTGMKQQKNSADGKLPVLFLCQTKKTLMITAAGIILGALGGYLYWRFIGCSNGTCPLTSNKLNSTLYGAAIGFLLTASGCSGKSVQRDQEDLPKARTENSQDIIR